MSTGDVYRRAARLADSGNYYSCNAIFWSCYTQDCLATVGRYERLFSPDEPISTAWGDQWGDERKACRVLALTLMAAIVDWEERYGYD